MSGVNRMASARPFRVNRRIPVAGVGNETSLTLRFGRGRLLYDMLRVLTFGGVALESDEASAFIPRLRPPRLALLTVLAASGERGCTRERLLGLFWAEAGEEHARHSLRQ